MYLNDLNSERKTIRANRVLPSPEKKSADAHVHVASSFGVNIRIPDLTVSFGTVSKYLSS
jgi:hypothetical protein